MDIYEQMKKDEEELKKQAEETTEESAEEDKEEEVEEATEDQEEQAEEEESTEELESEEDKKPEPKDFAAMRRQKREIAKQKAELQEMLEAIKAAKEQKPEPQEQLSEEESLKRDIEDVKTWKQTQAQQVEQAKIYQAAVQEFQSIEKEYMEEAPDYIDAMKFARGKYLDSLKVLQPNISEQAANHLIDQQILQFAAKSHQEGLNPAEELYDMAKTRFGYKAEKVEKKADISTIKKNKKRSASSLAGGKGGKASLSGDALGTMSNAEFAALTPSQLAELENDISSR